MIRLIVAIIVTIISGAALFISGIKYGRDCGISWERLKNKEYPTNHTIGNDKEHG